MNSRTRQAAFVVLPGRRRPSASPVRSSVLEQAPGQVFAAIDGGAFGDDLLLPRVLEVVQGGVLDVLVIGGAGEVEGEFALAGQQHQFQRLAVDGEGMPPEADALAAALEQLGLVADLLERVLAQGFEPGLQPVRAHGVAQAAQLLHQVAQLGGQGVGGEEGVHLLGGGEGGGARAQTGEDALGGLAQRLAAAVAGLDQGLAAGSGRRTGSPRAWWRAAGGTRRTRRSGPRSPPPARACG